MTAIMTIIIKTTAGSTVPKIIPMVVELIRLEAAGSLNGGLVDLQYEVRLSIRNKT